MVGISSSPEGARLLQGPLLPIYVQTAAQITTHLAGRFYESLPITRVSADALVVLNAFKTTTKPLHEERQHNPIPEVVEIVDGSLTRLQTLSENQAFLFLGEAGSGKSTIRARILSTILSKSDDSVSSKISLATYVFDCLTTSSASESTKTSKAGLLQTLHYQTPSNGPVLVGADIVSHHIQRSEIKHGHTGRRGYQILSYLLAGASDADRKHLGLKGSQESSHRQRLSSRSGHLRTSADDAEGFKHFKEALWELNFPQNHIARILEILATVIHISQLEFEYAPSASDSVYSGHDQFHEESENAVTVRNQAILDLVSTFLGVQPHDLESILLYQTRRLQDEIVKIRLDLQSARKNAATVAGALYYLIVQHILDQVNDSIRAPDSPTINTISIIDLPGLSAQQGTGSALDQLLSNSSAEFIYNLPLHTFGHRQEILDAEEITTAPSRYFDNFKIVKDLLHLPDGLLGILERYGSANAHLSRTLHSRFSRDDSAVSFDSPLNYVPGTVFVNKSAIRVFTVKHFAGEVEYSFKDLIDDNWEVVSEDLKSLITTTRSGFVTRLFQHDPSLEEFDPRNWRTAGDAYPRSEIHAHHPASAQLFNSLEKFGEAFTAPRTNPYVIYCLKSNDKCLPDHFNTLCVRAQVQAWGIPELAERAHCADFNMALSFSKFVSLASLDFDLAGIEREKAISIIEQIRWPKNEVLIGANRVLLNERRWLEMVQGRCRDQLRESSWRQSSIMDHSHPEHQSQEQLLLQGERLSGGTWTVAGVDTEAAKHHEADGIDFDTRMEMQPIKAATPSGGKKGQSNREKAKKPKKDSSRKLWLFVVSSLTFFIPDLAIRYMGKMERKDVRTAWREKLAINLLIWLSCGTTLFCFMVLPLVLCPTQHVYSSSELLAYDGDKGSKGSYFSIRGEVFDLEAFLPRHYPKYLNSKLLTRYAGMDITSLFPVQVSALCSGVNGSVSNTVTLDYKSSNVTDTPTVINLQDVYAQYHDFRSFTGDSRPDWYAEQMTLMRSRYKKGNVGYTAKAVSKLAKKKSNYVVTMGGRVYDLSTYIAGGRREISSNGDVTNSTNAVNFMDQMVLDLFQQRSGEDVTSHWKTLPLNQDVKDRMKVCLDNLFYIGDVDGRNSIRCQIADYLPLVVSVLLCSVIAAKFAASLQFSVGGMPETVSNFIICQIPAYTEDEESLRRAIDSVARMKYDDKRKLLVIICDGIVVGQGNDRSTPRIVLDILGVLDHVTPEALSFESIGQGLQRHNMGQVYSGLYEVSGHIVPFLVVVKVGKPSETSRPGNRGKRDSQMILMRFLNRVHYGLAMCPLELEIYHQIRNIIGVRPEFYEFILQVDADTIVAQDAATRMVAKCLDDTRTIAVCGETGLSNPKATIVTMIQVYEYFVSHNLTKAFESLFSCVTCLPGCFSMCRIFAADSGKPLFVSHQIVEDYATNEIDTLHVKNLLSLGEDRYLTTLLLKHHNNYKTKFIFEAQAWTIAPETWSVFLSQRRRWINSTVHNLIELLPMSQLCGFLVFSMRFVVMVDLITTVLQPVGLAYLIYLVIQIVRKPDVLPITAIVILAAIYGIQVITFVLRRKWDMAGWMLLSLLALPVFTLCLPLYSFWYMDDFNWGSTRVIAGEKGTEAIADEGEFDPDLIPRMHWDEYTATQALYF